MWFLGTRLDFLLAKCFQRIITGYAHGKRNGNRQQIITFLKQVQLNDKILEDEVICNHGKVIDSRWQQHTREMSWRPLQKTYTCSQIQSKIQSRFALRFLRCLSEFSRSAQPKIHEHICVKHASSNVMFLLIVSESEVNYTQKKS